MKAMIFAAGLGTRLKPLTDQMPKALVPVAEKPLIQHVIEKLTAAGYDDIVVNIHHFADMLERWIVNYQEEHPDIILRCSDEREKLLDTGGGIAHAGKLLTDHNNEGRFLIHNVDIISNVDLNKFNNSCIGTARHYGSGKIYAATLLVSERKTQRYLIFDDNMRLVGWTNIMTGEVKTPFPAVREAFDSSYMAPVDSAGILTSPFFRPIGSGPYRLYAFAGIHQMSAELLPLMGGWPDRFSVIDFYLSLCRQYNIHGYVQPGLRLMDVGKADYLDMAEEFVKSIK